MTKREIAMTQQTWHSASEVETFSPGRFDIIWNADYTMFRAVKLQWWDNASYIAYQSVDPCLEDFDVGEDNDAVAD